MWRYALPLSTAGALAAGPAMAQQDYGSGWDHPMMGWGGPLMGLLMFALVVAVVVAAILLVRYLWNVGHARDAGSTRAGGHGDALAILDRRYAQGEIDREEYLRRKEDLRA